MKAENLGLRCALVHAEMDEDGQAFFEDGVAPLGLPDRAALGIF